MSLAEIFRDVRADGVSKPTLYRRLQSLVEGGVIAKVQGRYALIKKSDERVLIARDLAKISRMKPILTQSRRGIEMTVYGDEKSCSQLEVDSITKAAKELLKTILAKEDPSLQEALENGEIGPDMLKKVVGKKVAVVLSFNGTDLLTLNAAEVDKKRGEAISLLAKSKGMTRKELCDELGITLLQLHQVIDPLLSAGLAGEDEKGNVHLLFELKGE